MALFENSRILIRILKTLSITLGMYQHQILWIWGFCVLDIALGFGFWSVLDLGDLGNLGFGLVLYLDDLGFWFWFSLAIIVTKQFIALPKLHIIKPE